MSLKWRKKIIHENNILFSIIIMTLKKIEKIIMKTFGENFKYQYLFLLNYNKLPRIV